MAKSEDERSYSEQDAVDAWSARSSRKDQYEVKQFTNTEGEETTQLIDKDTGSVTAEARGDNPWKKLVEHAGDYIVDDGSSPEEPEQEWTERGAPMTPTQPEALKVEQGRGDLGSVKPEDN